MSSKRTKRITNEIKEIENSAKILEESGIYFYYDDFFFIKKFLHLTSYKTVLLFCFKSFIQN